METSGIRVESIAISDVSRAQVRVPAEIQFDPDRVAHINTLVDGQLVTVDVTVGEEVQAGDQLATLRSAALGEARAELTRAVAARDAARVTLERQQRLREEGISSDRSLLEARLAFDEADAARNAARSRLRALAAGGGSGAGQVLRSPIDGVVIERHATRGESVSPEDTLFVIADASEVWVIGRLYEQHIALVRRGADATLTTSAHPDRQWTGVVDYVAISMDETSRTLPVRVSVANPDGALRPGMFGTLSLGGNTDGTAVLAVPVAAVQTLDGRDVIFVAGDSARTFEARTVELGREADGRLAVLEGLSRTDRIVVQGGFILKSELIRGQLADGCAGD